MCYAGLDSQTSGSLLFRKCSPIATFRLFSMELWRGTFHPREDCDKARIHTSLFWHRQNPSVEVSKPSFHRDKSLLTLFPHSVLLYVTYYMLTTLFFSAMAINPLFSDLLMQFLQIVERASGQLINRDKSCFVLPKNAPLARETLIANATGFRRNFLPLTYFGAPLYVGRTTSALFQRIIEKVRSRIQAWKCKSRLVVVSFSFAMYCLPCQYTYSLLCQCLGKWSILSNDALLIFYGGVLVWQTQTLDGLFSVSRHTKVVLESEACRTFRSAFDWNNVGRYKMGLASGPTT